MVLGDPRSAPVPRGWALAALGAVRARRGERDALEPLREAHALAEPTGELQRIGPVAAATAEAAWLAGEEAIGLEANRPRARARDAPPVDVAHRRACLLAMAGRPARRAPRRGVSGALPPLDRRRLGASQRALAADRLPLRSSACARGQRRPPTVRQAIDELQRMGARPRPRSSLAGCAPEACAGAARAAPTDAPEPGRSHRARARSAGALGRWVGQQADRTAPGRIRKTVGHHVSAVLRKLDVRTRGQAAAHARRLGLSPRAQPSGDASGAGSDELQP